MQLFSARRKGLTLIELLVVVVIIGVIVTPLLLTYRSYRTSQALAGSAEAVANHARSAHIFSREARDQREWGIRSTSTTGYAIFNSGTTGTADVQRYTLESGIVFAQDFEILFAIGTGGTDQEYVVELISTNDNRTQVSVSQNGIVEVTRL